MAMMLLEKKIAVDKVNKRGQTALAVSAENQQYECCKLLINNGANLYVRRVVSSRPSPFWNVCDVCESAS